MPLRKNPEIEINPDEPFANDRLDRSTGAKNLTRLIATVENPFVLSVEGGWGTGKTTFLKMWQRQLEKDGFVTIYFSAWENDFAEDPFVSLIGEIQKAIAAEGSGNRGEKFRKASRKVFRRLIPLAVKIAASKVLGEKGVQDVAEVLTSESADVKEFLGKLAEEAVADYHDQKEAIETFKQSLRELAEEIATGENHKPPVIVFVDELDRCRPPYAIALLERIKHLFGVPGVVFVLGVDRDQLGHSIRALYGVGMDVDGYLRRFVDLAYHLPPASCEKFAIHLVQRFDLEAVLQNQNINPVDYLIDPFVGLATLFALDLRTQEQCFTQLNLVMRIFQPGGLLPYAIFLIVLRAHNPELYARLCRGEASREAALSFLTDQPMGLCYVEENPEIEAFILATCLRKPAFDAEFQKQHRVSQDAGTDDRTRERGRRISDQMRFFGNYLSVPGGPAAKIAEWIEATRDFDLGR